MTIAELKESIEEMKIKEPDDLGKAYNNGLDFCIGMIDVYEKFREDEWNEKRRSDKCIKGISEFSRGNGIS